MGSWNGTCAITQLPITAGEPVAVFMLVQNMWEDNYCYSSSYFNPCLLPFFGKYNDYGAVDFYRASAVEDCSGAGLSIVVDVIKSRLTEIPPGPNHYHEPAASRDTFDIDQLFELDHEGRLYIDGNIDDGDIALSSKSPKLGKKCAHVIIHGAVFNHILDNWTQRTFTNDNTEQGYHYRTYGFKDIVDSIPAYIAEFRKQMKDSPYGNSRMSGFRNEILAARWIEDLDTPGSLFNAESLSEYSEEHTDAELTEVITDMVKGSYINAFMSSTRKAWIKQVGAGSQESDPKPYNCLIDAMHLAIKKQESNYDE